MAFPLLSRQTVVSASLCMAALIQPNIAAPTLNAAEMLVTRALAQGEVTDMATLTVPVAAGNTALPTPSAGVSVKAVTYGRGIQNYTCASSSSADKPKAIGAVATLYDLAVVPASFFNPLTSFVVNLDLAALDSTGINVLGTHFFDINGVPTFDLGPRASWPPKRAATSSLPPPPPLALSAPAPSTGWSSETTVAVGCCPRYIGSRRPVAIRPRLARASSLISRSSTRLNIGSSARKWIAPRQAASEDVSSSMAWQCIAWVNAIVSIHLIQEGVGGGGLDL